MSIERAWACPRATRVLNRGLWAVTGRGAVTRGSCRQQRGCRSLGVNPRPARDSRVFRPDAMAPRLFSVAPVHFRCSATSASTRTRVAASRTPCSRPGSRPSTAASAGPGVEGGEGAPGRSARSEARAARRADLRGVSALPIMGINSQSGRAQPAPMARQRRQPMIPRWHARPNPLVMIK